MFISKDVKIIHIPEFNTVGVEPTCPRCKMGNALLSRRHAPYPKFAIKCTHKDLVDLECRDCGLIVENTVVNFTYR